MVDIYAQVLFHTQA